MAVSGELGEFLRARRARLHPADVGLPAGTGLRRTPGLRREELAAVAGISIDYCIRLEQGKENNPGPAVLDALSAALRLNQEETAHLYALARNAAGRRTPMPTASRVRPGIRQLLDSLRPCPAYVLNRISDVLAANPEALALFVGLAEWPPERRNTIRYTFCHPAARKLFAEWPKAAASTAAHLHTVVAADPESPGLAALVDELLAGSEEFAGLWRRYDVRQRRGEVKAFCHPVAGQLTLTYEVLYLPEDGQRITVYQARPGSPDHGKMLLLSE